MPETPEYLRAVDVARILKVAPKTISRWAKEGKLPFVTTPGGHRRYPADAIRALARSLADDETAGPPDD